MVSAIIATNKLRARSRPRPLMVAGMLLAAGGMLYLSRLTVVASCATGILPALIMLRIGLGLVFSTSINSAPLGVEPADAGVASASVSAAQQIGGSLGTALLSTIAASALSSYITSAHAHLSGLLFTHAALHGDTTALAWAAGFFAAGALVAGVLFERGTNALRSTPRPSQRPPTNPTTLEGLKSRSRLCVTTQAAALSWDVGISIQPTGVKESIMRVFVAGATGAIGRQLVPRLVAAGHEVVGLTHVESNRALLHELGAKPAVADALDPDQVADAVAHAMPDVMVHELTAIGPVDMRHLDRDFAMTNRLRTQGTDYLLSAGRAAGVQRFVAQGVAGFGAYARTGGPVKREEDPLDPAPARELRANLAAIRHLEEAVLGATWTEGIVLRYGAFYG
ncbi:MAG: NAD-dependent epimerase/dehydratase family protein, partial [Solirubrobacterales bacterium]|nr:NAD-dependent epimerase/dehydratase family protein [Solirubrobacterales bacterium]